MTTVGTRVSRVEGPAKVTGRAKYAAEFQPPNLVYAAITPSEIPSGLVTAIDSAAAEATAGVLCVLTHLNADTLPYEPAGERPAVGRSRAINCASCRTRTSNSRASW